ncbi:MAG TPA: hypothetical protein VK843_10670 [Planctomycetota bacterium]|nr:hypothetical protein [Planctomycetota bacterium]
MTEHEPIDFRLEAPPGYVLQSEDGCYAVERMQFEHWKKLEPREKLALADEMCATMRELSLAGLRMSHPDWSEAQIARKGLEIWLGEECYQRFFSAGMLP